MLSWNSCFYPWCDVPLNGSHSHTAWRDRTLVGCCPPGGHDDATAATNTAGSWWTAQRLTNFVCSSRRRITSNTHVNTSHVRAVTAPSYNISYDRDFACPVSPQPCRAPHSQGSVHAQSGILLHPVNGVSRRDRTDTRASSKPSLQLFRNDRGYPESPSVCKHKHAVPVSR